MGIDGVLPLTLEQTFCLHIGGYEMRSLRRHAKMAFGNVVPVLCQGRFRFQQLLLYFASAVSGALFAPWSHLLNTDETMATYKLSFCRACAKLIN